MLSRILRAEAAAKRPLDARDRLVELVIRAQSATASLELRSEQAEVPDSMGTESDGREI